MTTTTDLASEIRTVILDIRDLYRELPDVIASIAGLHATRYDRVTMKKTKGTDNVRVPGGDAFVMHAGGTDNGVTSSKRGNRDHAIDNLPSDPPSVLAVLTRIEDTWREAQSAGAATITSIDSAVQYLTANATWAALNADIDSDLDDLYSLRTRLKACTGHIDTPKASDAPCVTCNGTIVQRYRAPNPKRPELGGLDDLRECNRCAKTYTPAQYILAVKDRLADLRKDEERLVTASEARIIWSLSPKQIYVWEDRTDADGTPKITPVGRNERGHRLYRNGDIAKLRKVS